MRLIIAGGRDFSDYNLLQDSCNRFIGKEQNIVIISGLAKGADLLGTQYAADHGYPLEGFAAEWGKYGRGAGLKRNKLMAKSATHLIAFWDSKSKGTMHMIDYAAEMNLIVEVVYYKPIAITEVEAWDLIRRDKLIK